MGDDGSHDPEYEGRRFAHETVLLGETRSEWVASAEEGVLGPSPMQMWAEQFLEPAGVALNRDGNRLANSMTSSISVLVNEEWWASTAAEETAQQWPDNGSIDGVCISVGMSHSWSVALTEEVEGSNRKSQRVAKKAAKFDYGPFTTQQMYEVRVQNPHLVSDDAEPWTLLAHAMGLRIGIRFRKTMEVDPANLIAPSGKRIAEVRIDAIFMSPEVPVVIQVRVFHMCSICVPCSLKQERSS